jgi:hypothetical protein
MRDRECYALCDADCKVNNNIYGVWLLLIRSVNCRITPFVKGHRRRVLIGFEPCVLQEAIVALRYLFASRLHCATRCLYESPTGQVTFLSYLPNTRFFSRQRILPVRKRYFFLHS